MINFRNTVLSIATFMNTCLNVIINSPSVTSLLPQILDFFLIFFTNLLISNRHKACSYKWLHLFDWRNIIFLSYFFQFFFYLFQMFVLGLKFILFYLKKLYHLFLYISFIFFTYSEFQLWFFNRGFTSNISHIFL